MRRIAVAVGVLLAAGCGSGGVSADAGDDFTVEVGSSPSFDGCGSSGDIVNYRWQIEAAPPDMADDVGKAIRESMDECSFSLEAAMLAKEAGSWEIELTVTDVDGNTSSDRVTVEVVG